MESQDVLTFEPLALGHTYCIDHLIHDEDVPHWNGLLQVSLGPVHLQGET